MPLRTFAVLILALCFVAKGYGQGGTSSPSGNNPPPPTAPGAPAPSPQDVAEASKKAKDASAAAAAVEQSLPGYGVLVLNVARYQKAITDITGSTSTRPQAPIEEVRTLQATVLAIQQNDLVNSTTKAIETLNKSGSKTIEADRKTKCDALPKSNQQDVVDAVKACSKAESDAAEQSKALSDQLASLKTALQSIYFYFSNQVGLPLPKLEPATALAVKNPDAAELLQKLAPVMSAMRAALENFGEYQSIWNTIRPVLKAWSMDPPPDPPGKTTLTADGQLKALADLKDKINTVPPKLSGWFEVITAALTASASSLDGMLTGVGTDRQKTMLRHSKPSVIAPRMYPMPKRS